MVWHASVEKLTTWKASLLLSQYHCPRKCLPRKVASRKVQPLKFLNNITPTVLRQAKEESRRTQSRPTRTTVSHILPNQSLHSLAQARCCLKRIRYLVTRQTHSLLIMGPVRLICRMCLPPHICTFQVSCRCRLINRLLPSRIKLPAITCTVWLPRLHINFPVEMIPRIQDMRVLSDPPSPYGYYPPQPLPVAGYPLSASTAAPAQHKLGRMVKFLVDKEKGEII